MAPPDIFVIKAQPEGRSNPAVNLTNNPSGNVSPAWSPDGKQIAFGSYRSGNLEIWRMRADGTHQVRLTNNPAIDGNPS
jgi:TolB protein